MQLTCRFITETSVDTQQFFGVILKNYGVMLYSQEVSLWLLALFIALGSRFLHKVMPEDE